jgi:hypothetical protein
MIEAFFSPEGFGPAILGVALGWIPVLAPIIYLAAWGRRLPRKLFFVATSSAFTLGLPLFILLGLEAPALILEPVARFLAVNSGLQSTAPVSWVLASLKLVSSWWWLATVVVFVLGASVWSALVSWWLGSRWGHIAQALAARKQELGRRVTNDA